MLLERKQDVRIRDINSRSTVAVHAQVFRFACLSGGPMRLKKAPSWNIITSVTVCDEEQRIHQREAASLWHH